MSRLFMREYAFSVNLPECRKFRSASDLRAIERAIRGARRIAKAMNVAPGAVSINLKLGHVDRLVAVVHGDGRIRGATT